MATEQLWLQDNFLVGSGATTGTITNVLGPDLLHTNAKEFDGSSYYVVDSPSFTSDTQGAVSFWVYLETDLANSESRSVLAYGSDATNQFFDVRVREFLGNHLSVTQRTVGDGDWTVVYSSDTLSAGAWHFCVIQSDGDAYEFWIDGTLSSISVPDGSNNGDWLGDTTLGANPEMSIGARKLNGSYSVYFGDGDKIHDLRYFSSPLTSTQTSYLNDTFAHKLSLSGLENAHKLNTEPFSETIASGGTFSDIKQQVLHAGPIDSRSFSVSSTPTTRTERIVSNGRIIDRTFTEARVTPTKNSYLDPLDESKTAETGHWLLDGDLLDDSGNSNDGTWQGGGSPSYTTGPDGAANGAIDLDGSHYVSVADDPAFDLSPNQDVSWSVWVKVVTVPREDAVIIDKREFVSSDYKGLLLNVDDATGKARVFLFYGSQISNLSAIGGESICDNEWHHLLVVADRDGDLSLYLDGVLDGSVSISAYAATDLATAANFTVGAKSAAASGNIPLTGQLADVRAYDAALTQDEITYLYDNPGKKLQTPVFESSDTNIATVKDNGQVTYVSDGTVDISYAGKSESVTVSKSDTFIRWQALTWQSYVDPNASKQIDDAIATGGAEKPLYSTKTAGTGPNYDNANYIRNTDCWAYNLDTTPISAWNNYVANRHQTIISRKHTIGCNHGSGDLPAGTVVQFVDNDNNVFNAVVADSVRIGSTDIQLTTYEEEFPTSLTVAKILPSDYADYLIRPSDTALLQHDYEEKALVTELESPPFGNYVNYQTPTLASRLALYEGTYTGDSGSPVLMYLNGEPIVLSAFHYGGIGSPGSGPSIQYYKNDIELQMGAYTLTAIDLSSFNSI